MPSARARSHLATLYWRADGPNEIPREVHWFSFDLPSDGIDEWAAQLLAMAGSFLRRVLATIQQRCPIAD
jgi:hypothetical protein